MNCCTKTAVGTSIKFIVSILDLPDNLTMDDVDFVFTFFIHPNRTEEVSKADMVRINKKYYKATLDTRSIGSGRIEYQCRVIMPDGSEDIIREYTDEILSPKI
jgi:hypothetical protein